MEHITRLLAEHTSPVVQYAVAFWIVADGIAKIRNTSKKKKK